jgi:hypothetical protein
MHVQQLILGQTLKLEHCEAKLINENNLQMAVLIMPD